MSSFLRTAELEEAAQSRSASSEIQTSAIALPFFRRTRWPVLMFPLLFLLVSAGELRAQERKPDEVIESVRPTDNTHLGRGPLSGVLYLYDDFLDRMREKYGIGFAVTYSPIYQFGGPGGSDNMTLNHELSIFADWTVFDHPIFGKGRFDLYAFHQADRLIGTSASDFADHVGSSWLLSNVGTETSLATLWWEQLLFDGHLDITIGQLDPTLLFDVNRYAGWDRVSFLASPVSGNPARVFETPGLGLYVEVLDSEIGYVIGTVMDADADSRYPDFESLGNGRWAYFLEAGLTPMIPSLGRLELGVTLSATDKTKEGPASRGVLVSLSQDIGDRYALFFRYGLNDGKRGGIDQMASTGIVFKGIFDFANDWIGASIMWAQPTESGLRDQYGIEIYWRLQLTERIQFTPDLQIIIHPTYRSHAKAEVVASLRLFFSL